MRFGTYRRTSRAVVAMFDQVGWGAAILLLACKYRKAAIAGLIFVVVAWVGSGQYTGTYETRKLRTVGLIARLIRLRIECKNLDRSPIVALGEMLEQSQK